MKIVRELQVYLVFLVLVHLLLLYGSIPHWVVGVGVALCAWKGLSFFYRVRAPKKFEIWLVGASGILLVFLSTHTLIGEEASSMVLALTASCKLAESKDYRDYAVTLILCFLLLMVYLLASQSLASLAFLLLDLVLLIQFLFQLHPAGSSLFSIKAALRLLALTIPAWALLFFLFPRFTVGFWHHETTRASTGFSDELNPGSVSQLAESDEIAFRVKFVDQSPPADQMYWRGSVLTASTSMRWIKLSRAVHLDQFLPVLAPSSPSVLLPDYRAAYQLWLEPFFKYWLFLLDFNDSHSALKVAGNSVVSRGGFVRELASPAVGRISYIAHATGSSPQLRLEDTERKQFLQLPPDLTADVMSLALELKKISPNAEIAAENLLHWFSLQRFHYSLGQGLKEKQTLSQFIFETKLGFCEHYAAAGAVLLRAMGYPSRVVVGFQGAELNSVSNYWLVRNRNAHAWDEVFVETDPAKKAGYWKRVDLVSVVTPLRMRLGAAYFAADAAAYSGAEGLSLENFRAREPWFVRSGLKIRMAFDAAEMQWLKFLTDYDFEQQMRFLDKLGVKDTSRQTFFVLLATLLAVWMLGFALFQRRKNLKVDAVLAQWKIFCELLGANGPQRFGSQGPQDYIQTCIVRYPRLKLEIEEIGQSFIQLRYELLEQSEQVLKLKGLSSQIIDLRKKLTQLRLKN